MNEPTDRQPKEKQPERRHVRIIWRQYRALQGLSRRTRKSIAVLVEEALDAFLRQMNAMEDTDE